MNGLLFLILLALCLPGCSVKPGGCEKVEVRKIPVEWTDQRSSPQLYLEYTVCLD